MEENQFLKDLYEKLGGEEGKFEEFQNVMISDPRYRKNLYRKLEGKPSEFKEFENRFVPREMMPDLQVELPGMLSLPEGPRTAPAIDPFGIFGEEREVSEQELYTQQARNLLKAGETSYLSAGEITPRTGASRLLYGRGDSSFEQGDLSGFQLEEVYNKDGGWFARVKSPERGGGDIYRTSPEGRSVLPTSEKKEIYLGPSSDFINEYNMMPPEERIRRYQEDAEFSEKVWRSYAPEYNDLYGITSKKEFDTLITNDTSHYYDVRSIYNKAVGKASERLGNINEAISESFPSEMKELQDLQDQIELEEARLKVREEEGNLEQEDIDGLRRLYEKLDQTLQTPVGEEQIPLIETPLMQDRTLALDALQRLEEWHNTSFLQSTAIDAEEKAMEFAEKSQSILDNSTWAGRQIKGTALRLDGSIRRTMGNFFAAFGQGAISLLYDGDESRAPKTFVEMRDEGLKEMQLGEAVTGTSDTGSFVRFQVELDDGNVAVVDNSSGQVIAIEDSKGKNIENQINSYQSLLIEKEVAQKVQSGEVERDRSARRLFSEFVDIGLDMVPMFVGSGVLTRAIGSTYGRITGAKVLSNLVQRGAATAGSATSIYSTMVGGHFMAALDQGLSTEEAWKLGKTNAAIESLVAISIGNVESRIARSLSYRERGLLKTALQDLYTGGEIGYRQLSSILPELSKLPKDIVLNVIEENTIIGLQALANAKAGIENAGITAEDIENTTAISALLGGLMSSGSAVMSTGSRMMLRDRLEGKDTFFGRIAKALVEGDPQLDILIDDIAVSNKVNSKKATLIKEKLNRVRDEYAELDPNLSTERKAEWAANAILYIDAEVNGKEASQNHKDLTEYQRRMNILAKPLTVFESRAAELHEQILNAEPGQFSEVEGDLEAYANLEDGSYIQVGGEWYRYETAGFMNNPIRDAEKLTELNENRVDASPETIDAFRRKREEGPERREVDGVNYIREGDEWKRERRPIKVKLKKTSVLSQRLEERFEKEGVTEIEEGGNIYTRNEDGVWETETIPTETVTDQELIDRLNRQEEQTVETETTEETVFDTNFEQFKEDGWEKEDYDSFHSTLENSNNPNLQGENMFRDEGGVPFHIAIYKRFRDLMDSEARRDLDTMTEAKVPGMEWGKENNVIRMLLGIEALPDGSYNSDLSNQGFIDALNVILHTEVTPEGGVRTNLSPAESFTEADYQRFVDEGRISREVLLYLTEVQKRNVEFEGGTPENILAVLQDSDKAIELGNLLKIQRAIERLQEGEVPDQTTSPSEATTEAPQAEPEAPEIFNHVRGGIEIPYQIIRNENGEVTDILREDGTPLKKGTNYWNRIRDNANEARPEETTEVNELTLEDGRQVRQEDGQWYYINEDGSTGRVVQERHTRVRAQINNKLREQERASTEATETAQETSAAEPIQETTAPESVETTTEPTPEATTETSAEPATETTTEQTISEGETSWYLDNNGRVVLVRRDGSNWVTTEGDVGATVPEQFAEQADQNIDREATPDEISKTLPENVVADPTEDGENVGTYAKYNPETDTWHESDPQGTEGEEITVPRRVNRLNEALERKQSAEETAPTETPQETPVEQTTQEETSTPEPTETDVTEASEPQTITHRGREYTRTVEEGNAIWRNKDGKQMSERYSTQLEKALETQAQTEAPAAETTETTPSETSGPQTATIDFRGKERSYTKEDGVWRNEAGREIKGERLINRLERQLEERAEQKPTEDVVVEEPLKKDLKDETKFSKEEQRVIEEGDGILEEVSDVLGRTTETDGNDAKQEAVSQSEVEATAKALDEVDSSDPSKRNVIINDESQEVYALSIGINPNDLHYLGEGEFGEAYSTESGKVIKITSSANEAEIAKNLIGKKGDHAEIYDVKKVDDMFVIYQEELDTDSEIEDNLQSVQNILSEQGLPIQYLDNIDYEELSQESKDEYDRLSSFISDLEDINRLYRNLGIEASDLQSDNLGYDENGKLKAFDLQDKSSKTKSKDVDVDLLKSKNEVISEAYHKAKADGSNPELVEAVEDLIGKPTAQEAEIDAIESKKVPAKVRGQKTVDGKTYNPIKSDNVTGRDWVDAETGEPVNKNSHVYEHLEGYRNLDKQKKTEEKIVEQEKELSKKEKDLKEAQKKEQEESEGEEILSQSIRLTKPEVAGKIGVEVSSIVEPPVDYAPKEGDVLMDNNTGHVVRITGKTGFPGVWWVDNLITGRKGETRSSLHMRGEWSLVTESPRMSAPSSVRVGYNVKTQARRSLNRSILNFFSKTQGLTNNIIASAEQMHFRLAELGFLSLETVKEFYDGNLKSLPLEKLQFFGNDSFNVVGFYDPKTNKIYLDPNRISPTNTMEEFVHMLQHSLRIAASRGDSRAINIINRAKRVFKGEVDAILRGEKGALGLDLSSNVYKRGEKETEIQHRDRIFDEVWSKAVSPEAVKRFKEEIKGRKGSVANLKRRAVGFLNTIKNFFLDSLGIDRKRVGNNPTIQEVIEQTNDALFKGQFLSDLSISESPTIDSSIQMSHFKKGDFNDNGTIKSEVIEELNSEIEQIREREDFMEAPNGKITNLTEEQWIKTQTQRFKDWFGDSKTLDSNGEPKVYRARINTESGTIMETVFIKSDKNLDSAPPEGLSPSEAMVAYNALDNYSESSHLRFAVEKGMDDLDASTNERKDMDNLAANRRMAARDFGRLVRDKLMPDSELRKIYDGAKKNRDNVIKVLSKIDGFKGEDGQQLIKDTMNIFDSVALEWAKKNDTVPELFYSSVLSNVNFISDAELLDGNTMGHVSINNLGQFVMTITRDANITTPVHELAHIYEFFLSDKEKNEIAHFFFGKGRTWDGGDDLKEAFANGFIEYVRNMGNISEGRDVSSIAKAYNEMGDFFLNILNGTKVALQNKDQYTNFNAPMRALYEKLTTMSLPTMTTEYVKNRRAEEKRNRERQAEMEYRFSKRWFDRNFQMIRETYAGKVGSMFKDIGYVSQNMETFGTEVANHRYVKDPTTAYTFAENMMYQLSQEVELGEGDNPRPSALDAAALGEATKAVTETLEELNAKIDGIATAEGFGTLKKLREKAQKGESLTAGEMDILRMVGKVRRLADMAVVMSQATSYLRSIAGFELNLGRMDPALIAASKYKRYNGKDFSKLSRESQQELIRLEREKIEAEQRILDHLESTKSPEEESRRKTEGAWRKITQLKRWRNLVDRYRRMEHNKLSEEIRRLSEELGNHPNAKQYQKKNPNLDDKIMNFQESGGNRLSTIINLAAAITASDSSINSFTALYHRMLEFRPEFSQNELYSAFITSDPDRQKSAAVKARSELSYIKEEAKLFKELLNHLNRTTEMFSKPGEYVPQEVPLWIEEMEGYMRQINYLSTLDGTSPEQTAILNTKLENIAEIYKELAVSVLESSGQVPTLDIELNIMGEGRPLNPEELANMTEESIKAVMEEIRDLREIVRERNLENREKKLLEMIEKLDKGTYEGDLGFRYFTEDKSSVDQMIEDDEIAKILRQDPKAREGIENYERESNLNDLLNSLYSAIQMSGKFNSFEEVVAKVKELMHDRGHTKINEAYIIKSIFRRAKPAKLITEAQEQVKMIKEEGRLINKFIELVETQYAKYDKAKRIADEKRADLETMTEAQEIDEDVSRSEAYQELSELAEKIREYSSLDGHSIWARPYRNELEAQLRIAQLKMREFLTERQASEDLEGIIRTLRDKVKHEDSTKESEIVALEKKVEEMYERYKKSETIDGLFSAEDDFKALMSIPGFAIKWSSTNVPEHKRRQELAKKKERELLRQRALELLQERIIVEEKKRKSTRRLLEADRKAKIRRLRKLQREGRFSEITESLLKGTAPIGESTSQFYWALEYFKNLVEGEKRKEFEDDELTRLVKSRRVIESKLRDKYLDITQNKAWTRIRQLANTPRLLTLAADTSFILYQGGLALPLIFKRGFAGDEGRENLKRLFVQTLGKGIWSELAGVTTGRTRRYLERISKIDSDWFDRTQADLIKRSYYAEAIDAGLQLTDPLNMRVEDRLHLDSFVEALLDYQDFSFHSLRRRGLGRLDRIVSAPIRLGAAALGKSARAIRLFSERTYISYMNELRLQLFEHGIDQLDKLNFGRAERAAAAEVWAEHVNVLTGAKRKISSSENINKAYNKVMQTAVMFFTAPRLYASAYHASLRSMYDPMQAIYRRMRGTHLKTGNNQTMDNFIEMRDNELTQKRARDKNMSVDAFMMNEYVRQMAMNDYATVAASTAMVYGAAVALQAFFVSMGMPNYGDDRWEVAFKDSLWTAGNPFHPNFMKLSIGGRVSTITPHSAYLRAWAKLLPVFFHNYVRDTEMDDFIGPRSYADMTIPEVVFENLKYKVSPIASPISTLVWNKDFRGAPVSDNILTRIGLASTQFMLPIAGQGVIENIREDGLSEGLYHGTIEGVLDLLGVNSYREGPYSDSRVRSHLNDIGFAARYYMGKDYGNLTNTKTGENIKKYIRDHLGEQILNSIKEGRPMNKAQIERAHKRIVAEAYRLHDQKVPKEVRGRSGRRQRAF